MSRDVRPQSHSEWVGPPPGAITLRQVAFKKDPNTGQLYLTGARSDIRLRRDTGTGQLVISADTSRPAALMLAVAHPDAPYIQV